MMTGIDAHPLPQLPQALIKALEGAARQPPPKEGARALISDVTRSGALPTEGLTTLGYARCLLSLGENEGAVIWGQIGTDRLSETARYIQALEAQVLVAQAHIALGGYAQGREALRGVGAALAHLYPEGTPQGPEATPFLRLRGRFAHCAGGLRLSYGERAEGEALFAVALRDLDSGVEAIAARVGLGMCALTVGDLPRALEALRGAHGQCRALGAREEELQVILALAPSLIVTGDIEGAQALGQRGGALAEDLGRRGELVACRALSAEASGDLNQVMAAIEAAAEVGASWAYGHLVLVAAHLAGQSQGPEAKAEVLLGGALGLLTQGRHALAEMLRGPLLAMGEEGVDLGQILSALEGQLGGGEG